MYDSLKKHISNTLDYYIIKIIFPLCFIIFLNEAKTQTPDPYSWCPTGATWLYNVTSMTSRAYYKVSYIGDSIGTDRTFKKMAITGFQYFGIPGSAMIRTDEYLSGYEYLYNEGDTVYWRKNGSDHTLYIFSNQVGTSWTIDPNSTYGCLNSAMISYPIQITNAQTATYSGWTFQVADLSNTPYWTIGGRIIKNIGSDLAPFPLASAANCQGIDAGIGRPEPLLCYFDDDRGYLNIGTTEDCHELITAVSTLESLGQKIELVPNPVHESFNISGTTASKISAVTITDSFGQILVNIPNPKTTQINTESLRQGIYFVTVRFLDNSVEVKRGVKL